MRKESLNKIIFILSLISLIITVKLFDNLGVYVDEAGTNPSAVLGGSLWLYANWIQLIFIGAITLLSGLSLFRKK